MYTPESSERSINPFPVHAIGGAIVVDPSGAAYRELLARLGELDEALSDLLPALDRPDAPEPLRELAREIEAILSDLRRFPTPPP